MERSLYEDSIRTLLPRLDPDTLTKVLDQLDHLGYADDFNLRGDVEEKDLKPFMKEGLIRIILRNWSAPNPVSEAGPSTSRVGSRCAPEYQDDEKLEARRIEKNKCLQRSHVIKHGRPQIRQLEMQEDYVNQELGIRRVSYGEVDYLKPMKTILLVGATGAGKSTLINAFANHLLGVKFEDGYRFRIVEESLDANQARSQTKSITAYIFYHQATFPDEFDCSLMIVDTPGYGDIKGIEQDEKIEKKLKHFFTAGHSDGGIDELHAVGFVVQASLPRLTPTQAYIFNAIVSIFGKDISENISLLTTFADGQKPPVIAAAEDDKVPYAKFFKFNNSALFADRPEIVTEEQSFDETFWSMGVTSYNKFLRHVANATSKSLILTSQVLVERAQLQTRVLDLHRKIKLALGKSDNLGKALDCFTTNSNEIEKNKDFTFEIKKPKINRIRMQEDEYVTNCLKCNVTCHYPCKIAENADKWKCAAMSGYLPTTAKCMICVGGCVWSDHVHMNERFEVTEEIWNETAQNMKARYEKACEVQLSTEDVILRIITDTEVADTKIVTLIEEVRRSLDRLSEIALRPDRMTTAGYITVLIKSEEQQARPGWEDRVEQLRAVRERAQVIKHFAEFHGISEPFQELKKEILEMKANRKTGCLKEGGMLQSLTKWRDTTVDWRQKTGKLLTRPDSGRPRKK